MSYYSILRFTKAMDAELAERLNVNAREVATILADFRTSMELRRDRYTRDPNLSYGILSYDSNGIRLLLKEWLKTDFVSSLTVFARDGRMLATSTRESNREARFSPAPGEAVFLNSKHLVRLKDNRSIGLVEVAEAKRLSLVLISRVQNTNGKIIGYLEQVIDLDKAATQRLKNKLKLELMILTSGGDLLVGSHPDFASLRKDLFHGFLVTNDLIFNMEIRGEPFGFLVFPVDWDQSQFRIALGTSKTEVQATLRNIRLTLLTVVGTVIALLVLTSLVISDWVLKPLNELISALRSFESQEQAITIPVKDLTEIGLLTESFNQMSHKIAAGKRELQRKIGELENANKELKDTQTKLVHSAKMISLGQLVAGVAHELNNPIGFIYSNMNHLRDYTQKLFYLIKIAESNPRVLESAKEEVEFSYIVEDLPKLISSCEDGARRTRDIVIGLRNFSRLEAAKLSEVDVCESIDKTLNLLSGEIKNRIEVHKSYEPVPTIHAYDSQVHQIFMNLLSNAVQAIDGQGKIWITVQTEMNYSKKTSAVKVSIQDSGRGMSAETIEKIFDPFFTTKDVGKGTGLGLSIIYGIVQNHGGEIQVKSQIGLGTEFIVLLPVEPPNII